MLKSANSEQSRTWSAPQGEACMQRPSLSLARSRPSCIFARPQEKAALSAPRENLRRRHHPRAKRRLRSVQMSLRSALATVPMVVMYLAMLIEVAWSIFNNLRRSSRRSCSRCVRSPSTRAPRPPSPSSSPPPRLRHAALRPVPDPTAMFSRPLRGRAVDLRPSSSDDGAHRRRRDRHHRRSRRSPEDALVVRVVSMSKPCSSSSSSSSSASETSSHLLVNLECASSRSESCLSGAPADPTRGRPRSSRCSIRQPVALEAPRARRRAPRPRRPRGARAAARAPRVQRAVVARVEHVELPVAAAPPPGPQADATSRRRARRRVRGSAPPLANATQHWSSCGTTRSSRGERTSQTAPSSSTSTPFGGTPPQPSGAARACRSAARASPRARPTARRPRAAARRRARTRSSARRSPRPTATRRCARARARLDVEQTLAPAGARPVAPCAPRMPHSRAPVRSKAARCRPSPRAQRRARRAAVLGVGAAARAAAAAAAAARAPPRAAAVASAPSMSSGACANKERERSEMGQTKKMMRAKSRRAPRARPSACMRGAVAARSRRTS